MEIYSCCAYQKGSLCRFDKFPKNKKFWYYTLPGIKWVLKHSSLSIKTNFIAVWSWNFKKATFEEIAQSCTLIISAVIHTSLHGHFLQSFQAQIFIKLCQTRDGRAPLPKNVKNQKLTILTLLLFFDSPKKLCLRQSGPFF